MLNNASSTAQHLISPTGGEVSQIYIVWVQIFTWLCLNCVSPFTSPHCNFRLIGPFWPTTYTEIAVFPFSHWIKMGQKKSVLPSKVLSVFDYYERKQIWIFDLYVCTLSHLVGVHHVISLIFSVCQPAMTALWLTYHLHTCLFHSSQTLVVTTN